MITTLTFDLDDTLWSTHEVIGRAEQILFDYLRTHCPAFVEQHSVQSFAKMRQGLIAMDPARAHNLRRLRRDALAIEFQRLGQPNADALADQASQIFQTARQQVNFWPGILEALAELATHYQLIAITNGTTDILASQAGEYFSGAFRADQFTRGKPDPEMFQAAMAAHDFTPAQAVHVGDHWDQDILAAKALGLATAWISTQPAPGPEADWHLSSVRELPDALAHH